MRKILRFAVILSVCIAPITSVYAQLATVRAIRKDSNPEQITAAQMHDYLSFVASDEMEGRNTPSRGLDTTARFIATLLSRWGAKPAGDEGTFFQRIPLRRDNVDPEKCRLEFGGRTFTYGDDYTVG